MDFLHRTWAEIDINALKHNFELIKNYTKGAKLMAVVKADAYGHSAKDIAPVLDEAGAEEFAVSNIDEAISLRSYGIKKPILILGYTPVNMAKELYNNNITQTVYSAEYAMALSEQAVKNNINIDIHIKIDTGMGRLGFDCRDNNYYGIEEAINSAKLSGLNFVGIYTHFAQSDRAIKSDDDFTCQQYARFLYAIDTFKKAGLKAKVCHCCNSAAFCLDEDKHFDMCRPGIVLYGLTPSDELDLNFDFTPVMTVKSVISMVKYIKKGQTVSYGRTYTADKDIKVATVTAGYADGYPRMLSNNGYVIIGGKKAKIIGRVCMDQMCIDVTNIADVKQGDEVTLFGKDLPVEELAKLCGTINYEIICGISPRVPRIIIK